MEPISKKLIVAISSRALFDLDDCHQVYEQQGLDAYQAHQVDHENEILKPGAAFILVKKLLALNDEQAHPLVEVVLLSRNTSDTGLRVFNSIENHGLNVSRAVFTGGQSPYGYLRALGAHLFLSANPDDVRNALNHQCAAATILSSSHQNNTSPQLRIAFDGDAVLFSDEAQQIFEKSGLAGFTATEKALADQPLSGGPFKPFIEILQILQHSNPNAIRTALVTARGAPAHKRVIHTLRSWNVRIDEVFFLGGVDKGEFLRAFSADIFFDDHPMNCEQANQHVATGHVPSGVLNL